MHIGENKNQIWVVNVKKQKKIEKLEAYGNFFENLGLKKKKKLAES